MYIIDRLDKCSGEWHYMNSAETYTAACELREWMENRFGGYYRIREV